ncbi:MAG: hypothetical protein KAJ29_00040 [Alphaproteobacteria bacterium]|nr:hypothetical protein [Alphaproteobacteria bacterium]
MPGSSKNSDVSDNNPEEFDDDLEFEDEFGFDEEWDDDEYLEQSPVDDAPLQEDQGPAADTEKGEMDSTTEEAIPVDSPPVSPSAIVEEALGTKQETQIQENLEQIPDEDLKPESKQPPRIKKKKKPFILLGIVLTILLIVGLTVYNTLRQSLAPTPIPIVKLTGSPEEQNDDNFIDEAQKRVDEIKPVEQELSDTSVLTPLPFDLDEMKTERPPLEQAQLSDKGVEGLELSNNSEFMDSESVTNPFSEDNLFDEEPEDASLPVVVSENETDGEDVTIIESSEMQKLQVLDDGFLFDEPDDSDDMASVVELINRANDENETESQDILEEKHRRIEAEAEAEARAKAQEEAARRAAEIKAVEAEKEKTNADTAAVTVQKIEKAVPKPQWEIRSIRPGRAVLYDTVSGNIEAVEPGNKIRGLGRIKEVAKKKEGWGVFGSEGNVTQ